AWPFRRPATETGQHLVAPLADGRGDLSAKLPLSSRPAIENFSPTAETAPPPLHVVAKMASTHGADALPHADTPAGQLPYSMPLELDPAGILPEDDPQDDSRQSSPGGRLKRA